MLQPQDVIAAFVSRGVPQHIAQGITANMMSESRLNPGINEAAPVVAGSRGGFGLNQWTGPRRRALEAAAAARGVPVDDLDFQVDYTMEELQGPERRAWDALAQTGDAETAARVYSEKFLRPGIPHLENRLANARKISGIGGDANVQTSYGPAQNALAAPRQQSQQDRNALLLQVAQQFAPKTNRLDPEAFMNRTRF